MVDKNALEIGALFRQAKDGITDRNDAAEFAVEVIEGSVTGKRNFSRKISRSRNGGVSCAHCQEQFAPSATRFMVFDFAAWGPAPVCTDCFKAANENSIGPLKRGVRKCEGCGQPINTVLSHPRGSYWLWMVCSNACYQRAYRKRRRGQDSVVLSKGGRARCCKACGHDDRPPPSGPG